MVLLQDQGAKNQRVANPSLLHRIPGGIFFVGALVIVLIALGLILLLPQRSGPSGSSKNTNIAVGEARTPVVIPKVVEQIRASLAADDFAIVLTPDTHSTKVGKPVTYSFTVVRGEGFDEPVTVTANGLPETVTSAVEPSPVPGDKEQGTITLSIPQALELGKYQFSLIAKASAAEKSADAVLVVSDISASEISVRDVRAMDTGVKWQATISWKTDVAANSWIEYAPEASYIAERQTYAFTSTNTANDVGHELTLYYLEPDTAYHFRIKSVDRLNNTVVSDDETLTTTAQ